LQVIRICITDELIVSASGFQGSMASFRFALGAAVVLGIAAGRASDLR